METSQLKCALLGNNNLPITVVGFFRTLLHLPLVDSVSDRLHNQISGHGHAADNKERQEDPELLAHTDPGAPYHLQASHVSKSNCKNLSRSRK
jgi:hypothetical protein